VFGPAGLAWSPDGKTLAAAQLVPDGGGRKARVQLWDAASGRPLPSPTDSCERIAALAWSPDGSKLLAGGQHESVEVWDARGGRRLHTFAYLAGEVWGATWSTDSRTVAVTGTTRNIRLWDTATGKPTRVIEGPLASHGLAWSPDGKVLAAGCKDGTARLWDPGTGKLAHVFAGHASHVDDVAWSSDSQALASLGREGALRLWDVKGRRPAGVCLSLDEEQSLAVGSDGHFRASARLGEELVYVVVTDQGQETLGPEEFARKYGWKNDPERVRLLGE
jgi:WD40 repeat protein